jgi:thioredoxin 1
MKPHIEKLMKEGYSIEMVDIDEQPTIAESAEVRGVPTTAIYENGQIVERVVGYEDYDRLKKRLDIYS